MRSLIAAVLVLLTFSSALAADLPKPPEGAPRLGVQPVAQCGAEEGVYEEVYDLNPATEAAFAYYGRYVAGPGGQPSFEPPFAARLVDDAGRSVVHYDDGDRTAITTIEAFAERFSNGWCSVLKARRGERA